MRSGALLALTAVLLLAVSLPAGGTSGAFTARIVNGANAVATKARFLCADTFAATARAANAYFEYRLSDPAGTPKATDVSAARNDGTYTGSGGATPDTATPTACGSDDGQPYQLDGSTSGVTTSVAYTVTVDFSIEVWFKTTVAGGKLIGSEVDQTGSSSTQHDKVLYIGGPGGSAGYLFYGVYLGGNKTISSTAAVNDGRWHQAVATTSAAGSTLYLDGVTVASSSAMSSAQSAKEFWRIGQGRLSGNWASAVADKPFTGSLRFAAAYRYVLSADEVASSYSVGRPTS